MSHTNINELFILNQIVKFNNAKRKSDKDNALTAVGLHVKLFKKSEVAIDGLYPAHRHRVVRFLEQFCREQGLKVRFPLPY